MITLSLNGKAPTKFWEPIPVGEESISLQLRRPSFAELEEFSALQRAPITTQDKRDTVELLVGLVVDWRGIVDQHEQPIEFTPDALKALFVQHPDTFWRMQLIAMGAFTGDVPGNSRSPSRRPSEADQSSTSPSESISGSGSLEPSQNDLEKTSAT